MIFEKATIINQHEDPETNNPLGYLPNDIAAMLLGPEQSTAIGNLPQAARIGTSPGEEQRGRHLYSLAWSDPALNIVNPIEVRPCRSEATSNRGKTVPSSGDIKDYRYDHGLDTWGTPCVPVQEATPGNSGQSIQRILKGEIKATSTASRYSASLQLLEQQIPQSIWTRETHVCEIPCYRWFLRARDKPDEPYPGGPRGCGENM